MGKRQKEPKLFRERWLHILFAAGVLSGMVSGFFVGRAYEIRYPRPKVIKVSPDLGTVNMFKI